MFRKILNKGVDKFRLETLCVLFFCIFGPLYILLPVFLGRTSLLTSFDDDAFYYFKIASNIALGNGSTFNGIYDTNGYHPLWMLILALQWLLSRAFEIDPLILVKISIVFFYLLTLRMSALFCKRYIESDEKLLNLFFTALTSVFYLYISSGGMEVVLAIPIIMYLFLLAAQRRPAILITIVFTAAVLSRLDSIIFLAPLMAFVLFDRWRSKREVSILLAVPSFFISIYLLINYYKFGLLVPVSGIAKSSNEFVLFSSEAWNSIFIYTNWKRINVFAVLAIPIVGVLIFPRSLSETDRCNSRLAIAMVGGCFLFYFVTALRSDWPLWPWYFFPMYFLFLALIVSGSNRTGNSHQLVLGKIGRLVIVVVSGAYLSYALLSSTIDKMLYRPSSIAEAEEISKFINDHPGIYAMGDRAGMVGYLSTSPIIQIEGLVMNKAYLKFMHQNGMTVNKILEFYGVNYYINYQVIDVSGCFNGREPIFGKFAILFRICKNPIERLSQGANIFHLGEEHFNK